MVMLMEERYLHFCFWCIKMVPALKLLSWHINIKNWLSGIPQHVLKCPQYRPVFFGQSLIMLRVGVQYIFHLPIQTNTWVSHSVPSAPVILNSGQFGFSVVMTTTCIRLTSIWIYAQNNTRLILRAIRTSLFLRYTFISYGLVVFQIMELTRLKIWRLYLTAARVIQIQNVPGHQMHPLSG